MILDLIVVLVTFLILGAAAIAILIAVQKMEKDNGGRVELKDEEIMRIASHAIRNQRDREGQNLDDSGS